MGMGGGNTGGAVSEINVTPLIDVLLVLLIIFMVIVPVTPKGLDALLPQPHKARHDQPEDDRMIVVQITPRAGGGDPGYKITEDDVSKGDLLTKSTTIFATRGERVKLVK